MVAFDIPRSQAKLQNAQKHISSNFVNQQPEIEIFPICQHVTNGEMDETEDDESWWSNLTKYQLTILIISMIQNSICWGIEIITLFYYIVNDNTTTI